MSNGKNASRGRRFTSEENANDFAEQVNGTVKDLRDCQNSKSDFKVEYTKGDANKATFTNPHWNK